MAILKTIADGYVCSDCIFMMANGETGDPDHSDAKIEEIAQATAGWCGAEDAEHLDQEFSTSPCRTCRSPLYGSRFWAVKLG